MAVLSEHQRMKTRELSESDYRRAKALMKTLKQNACCEKNIDYGLISEIQNVIYCLTFARRRRASYVDIPQRIE